MQKLCLTGTVGGFDVDVETASAGRAEGVVVAGDADSAGAEDLFGLLIIIAFGASLFREH